MKRYLLIFLIGFARTVSFGQNSDSSFFERAITLSTATGNLYGTLTLPVTTGKHPVALIIAGSGPTDRNGNSLLTQNNGYKMLGEGLAKNGIATVRYDKRGIMASAKAMKAENDLRFEDYINDAIAWIELLKKDDRFSSVTVIGHSEGSLIGMVAARSGANAYISIAGPGKPIDAILKEQYQAASKELYDLAVPVIDSLKKGLAVKNVDKRVFNAFRPAIQPYMISWMKYDPVKEIKKLKIPVCLIQGEKDKQVPLENEQLLYAATKAYYELFPNMNHVLKNVEDEAANAASYHNFNLPLAEGLVEGISGFIKKNVK
jgi:pimeloyl-ACP methyl ester carboxylesterase